MSRIIRIGITDCKKFKKYQNWLKNETRVEVIKLSHVLNNPSDITQCDGLVLTGGEDVHPRFYNKPEYFDYCDEDYMNEERDDFEWDVLQKWQSTRMPMLGICRGLQLVNIFFGGTLIPDIPSFGKYNHVEITEGRDRYHTVSVDPGSMLHSIVKTKTGEINSAHHQSADRVGKGLVANCMSEDGVIEGLERTDAARHPWLLLVQWHPERMTHPENPFSKNVRENFLNAVTETCERVA